MSAGIEPRGAIHPLTQRVLAEVGIDADGLRVKGVQQFLAKIPVQHAILLSEPGEDHSPKIYPFAKSTSHWYVPDPSNAAGSDDDRLAVFRHTRDLLDDRIRCWLREGERHVDPSSVGGEQVG